MSKKKRKAKKHTPGTFLSQPALNAWIDRFVSYYSSPTLHIKLTHEGKLYEGDIPCVGVDE